MKIVLINIHIWFIYAITFFLINLKQINQFSRAYFFLDFKIRNIIKKLSPPV